MKNLIYRVAQLSESLGIKLDAGIVWDAIPYSFVVDWFLNVSEWLHDNASASFYDATLKALGYCHSGNLILTRSIDWGRLADHLVFTPEVQTSRIYDDSFTIYRRNNDAIPLLKRTNLELSHTPWKIDRILNAGSLIVQRVLK
jgi:hypothetical protein